MKRKIFKDNWKKLDNTAKIFSLDDKKNTNIFRYSVLLKEAVDEKNLYDALIKTLDDYPAFKVKIGTGLFWNYLDVNFKEPIIEEESEIPCEHINFRKNNNYLFKVTYYKNKINLDIFHVLTDGTGAMLFFKTLIYYYLDLKHDLSFKNKNDNYDKDNIDYSDQYLKYYNKNYKTKYNFKPAYQIPDKSNKGINNTHHYTVKVGEIKKVCKDLNVTITEYLTAVYIYAMYLSIYHKDSNKEISITVPIDLRKYYNTETLANFFTCMNIISNLTQKEHVTFEELLHHIQREFTDKLADGKIDGYLTRDVNLGMSLSIRLIPLFIKKLFIKFIGMIVDRASTSTLSNVGKIDIDEKYKKFIDNIFVLVMPCKNQKVKCTICSYDDKFNITLNSNINDEKLENEFLKLIQTKIKNVEIESNNINKKNK